MCKEIVELTIRNGGYTDSIDKTGFVVAVKGNEEVVSLDEFNEKIVHKYKKEMEKGLTLGTWLHKGKVYLDTVKVFSDKEEALRLAKSLNEIAIYDLGNDEELFLN